MPTQEMSRLNIKDISFISQIKSMAVIGPSKGRDFIFLRSHQENFKGELYAVHPTLKEIPGFDDGTQGKIYPSLKDIPNDVDFVFIAVPSSQVLSVMKDCVDKGVKLASIFTAEFSDSGTEEGEALEKELLKVAQNKVRILGPNGMGLTYPRLGIAWRPKFPTNPGNLSFISQSGGISNIAVYMSTRLGINFSKVFSFGNGNDIDFVDLLYYLSNDPETDIILCYLEGIKKNRGKDLKAVLAQNSKPIIMVKGGVSNSGSFAAQTHTAAITGEHRIWKAIFEQFGVIEVESIEQMMHTAKLIDFHGLVKVKNVAVFSISGGYGVILVDLLEKHGINVPPFSPHIQKEIDSRFFVHGTSSKNPLDVSAQIFASRIIYEIMDLALSDDNLDGLVMDIPPWYFSQDFHIIKNKGFERHMIKAFSLGKKHHKLLIPIIQNVNCPEDRARIDKLLTEKKIPVFADPLEFIPLLQKISKLANYSQERVI
ncbi:MAG: CoA-binding protein [Promethearchaeota archaeon]